MLQTNIFIIASIFPYNMLLCYKQLFVYILDQVKQQVTEGEFVLFDENKDVTNQHDSECFCDFSLTASRVCVCVCVIQPKCVFSISVRCVFLFWAGG